MMGFPTANVVLVCIGVGELNSLNMDSTDHL